MSGEGSSDGRFRVAAALRGVATALLELVYPPRCAACGGAVAAEPFCPVCGEAVDPVPEGCLRCGLPGPDPLCGACRADPPAFDAVRAGGLFGGPLADAIHAFKYGGRPALARPLGAWLARAAPLPPGALVVSVPLARGRRIARGYDQAALLADALARAAGARDRRLRGALLRTRETPPQVGRTRAERNRNVAGAFSAARPAELAGRDVVLVDDVVTTGATADAAARALKGAGARSVVVLALARAD
ncbi:ComF family protein [Anaeromyxobacter terrae]|uniref:ComF family protein n=1 Tax=Anaeromyxobacter terrae TaxID=2925406 RepID=UPI001F56851E|nr:phosphoribosyltransferase family protein [Anaeromyxobacter sp. SG22]